MDAVLDTLDFPPGRSNTPASGLDAHGKIIYHISMWKRYTDSARRANALRSRFSPPRLWIHAPVTLSTWPPHGSTYGPVLGLEGLAEPVLREPGACPGSEVHLYGILLAHVHARAFDTSCQRHAHPPPRFFFTVVVMPCLSTAVAPRLARSSWLLARRCPLTLTPQRSVKCLRFDEGSLAPQMRVLGLIRIATLVSPAVTYSPPPDHSRARMEVSRCS